MKQYLWTAIMAVSWGTAFTQNHADYFGDGYLDGIGVVTSNDQGPEEGRNTLLSSYYEFAPEEQKLSRFLSHATFGATRSSIEEVRQLGLEAWLENQINLPASFTTPLILEDMADFFVSEYEPKTPKFLGAWYHTVLTAPDQLRHRVAFALSQLLVLSYESLNDPAIFYSSYYDLLVEHAFGNYRDLLMSVTRHATMGYYLSHYSNSKADPEKNTFPDENFAREIMQLFSIGLYELNLDGTRKVDENGNFISTYDNNDIKELAKVFTGLGAGGVRENAILGYNIFEPDFDQDFFPLVDPTVPMAMYEEFHETGEKRLPDGVSIPAGRGGLDDINQAIDFLFNHPNVGPFIGRRLIQRLVKSNPTPGYVARVASVFNDNGLGIRGDLAALVKAIILDPEARDCINLLNPKNGRLKEPILRYTQLLRAFSVSNEYNWLTTTGLNLEKFARQNILSAPSVFNFYHPDFAPRGEISRIGLVAPEYQIFNSNSSIGYINLASDWTLEGNPLSIDLLNQTYEIIPSTLDIGYEIALLQNGTSALIDHIDLLLCEGQMSSFTKKTIADSLEDLQEYGSYTEDVMVHLALYLTMVSPDFVIMR